VDAALDADRIDDSRDELSHLRGELALILRDGRRRLRGDRRDDLCRRETNAEQPSLALRDDLEANRRLVETGLTLLELAQRRPLSLADRLAGSLDADLFLDRHRLVLCFFFRFTRRG